MKLALTASENIGLADPGHTLELRLDRVFDEVMEERDVSFIGIFFRRGEEEPRDGAFGETDAADDGLVRVGGIGRHLLEAVRHSQERDVDIGPDGKGEGDLSLTIGARALHTQQALERLQLLFLFVDDLALDLLRARAWPDGADRDVRLVHVGRELHRNAEEGKGAERERAESRRPPWSRG